MMTVSSPETAIFIAVCAVYALTLTVCLLSAVSITCAFIAARCIGRGWRVVNAVKND